MGARSGRSWGRARVGVPGVGAGEGGVLRLLELPCPHRVRPEGPVASDRCAANPMMDEPWWEGRVASDVHCTLREKVSSSPPRSWGWAFNGVSIRCPHVVPRRCSNSRCLAFVLPFPFSRSVVGGDIRDLESFNWSYLLRTQTAQRR